MLASDGKRETEIKEKIMIANNVFYANKKLLKSRILGRNVKMNRYKTIIRPSLMYYVAETLSMTKKREKT